MTTENAPQDVGVRQFYPGGHSYEHPYVKTELCCPHCGRKDVWEGVGQADYYTGTPFLCIYCAGEFCLPYGDGEYEEPNTEKTRGPIHLIREAISWKKPGEQQ